VKPVISIKSKEDLTKFYGELYDKGYFRWGPNGLSYEYAAIVYSAIHDLGFILDYDRTFPPQSSNVIWAPSINGLSCSFQEEQIMKWLETHFKEENQENLAEINKVPEPRKPSFFRIRSRKVQRAYWDEMYAYRRATEISVLRLLYWARFFCC
jgi:hypothetical protein